jgi:hypothetical protein
MFREHLQGNLQWKDPRREFGGGMIDCLNAPKDVVVTTDWGRDDAINNVIHAIANVSRAFAREPPIVTGIDGVPSFADPTIGSAVLHRFLDTHQASEEFKARIGKRLRRKRIKQAARGLVCLEVYDRLVGDGDRVIAAAEGWLRFGGGESKIPEYRVPVNVLGVPANGILRSILRRLDNVKVHRIENPDLKLENFGCVTWDGRTAFTPAAALLSAGVVKLSEFGRQVDIAEYPWINLFRPIENGHGIEVGAVFIDEFGNIKLGIGSERIAKFGNLGDKILVSCNEKTFEVTIGQKFADVGKGKFVIYPGSNRLLELAVNQGNAAEAFGLSRADISTIRHENEIRPAVHFVISSLGADLAAGAEA